MELYGAIPCIRYIAFRHDGCSLFQIRQPPGPPVLPGAALRAAVVGHSRQVQSMRPRDIILKQIWLH